MAGLHYLSQGSGQPLVILHGLFGSGKNWQSLARKFSDNYEVITVDLRNHGQSFHADEMNYEVMSRDVIDLLRTMNLKSCNLLGHSMGGKVAMTVAMNAPEMISNLVIVDIAPVAYQHEYDAIIQPILELPIETLVSRADVDRELQASIPDNQLRAFLLHNLVSDAGHWAWRVNWRAIQQNLPNITGFDTRDINWSINNRCLFVNGANSEFVGEQEQEVIQAHFGDFQINTIPGAGHWLHAEKPLEFYHHTITFLDR